jgi:hypothetical protein
MVYSKLSKNVQDIFATSSLSIFEAVNFVSDQGFRLFQWVTVSMRIASIEKVIEMGRTIAKADPK